MTNDAHYVVHMAEVNMLSLIAKPTIVYFSRPINDIGGIIDELEKATPGLDVFLMPNKIDYEYSDHLETLQVADLPVAFANPKVWDGGFIWPDKFETMIFLDMIPERARARCYRTLRGNAR